MLSLKCGAKVRYYFDIAKCFLSFLCFVTYFILYKAKSPCWGSYV